MPRRLPSGRVVASNTRVSRRSMASRSTGTRGSWKVLSFRRALRKALPGFSNDSPFPPVKSYKLVYEHDSILNVGTSGVTGTQHVFNLNSLYDPDRTGTGHQPYGYDALQVAYSRYKVNGCLVEIELYNIQTINAIKVVYSVENPSNVAQSLANLSPEALGERQNAEQATMTTAQNKKLIKFYMPMHKAFNITKLQYKANIDNTTAGVGGDPGSVATLHLASADPNGNSSGGVRYKLKLTYFSTLYTAQDMAQS